VRYGLRKSEACGQTRKQDAQTTYILLNGPTAPRPAPPNLNTMAQYAHRIIPIHTKLEKESLRGLFPDAFSQCIYPLGSKFAPSRLPLYHFCALQPAPASAPPAQRLVIPITKQLDCFQKPILPLADPGPTSALGTPVVPPSIEPEAPRNTKMVVWPNFLE